MADLPYSPAPQQEATGGGLPGESLSTPPGAFGAGVAEAAGSLGKTAEQVGQQQFGLALKFQQMQNETWANEATSEFSKDLSNIQMEYRQLHGLERTTRLKEFQDRVQQSYLGFANGAGSPAARLNFLTQARRYADYTIDSFGTLAADAADQAHDSSLRGSVATAQAQAINTFSLVNHDQTIEDVMLRASDYADYKGWTGEDKYAYVQKAVGDTYTGIATTLINEGKYDDAEKVIDEAVNKKIPGTDLTVLSREDQSKLSQQARLEQTRRSALDEKAKKDAADAAYDKFASDIVVGKFPSPTAIAADPSLSGEQKLALSNQIYERAKRIQEGQFPTGAAAQQAPVFLNTLQRIMNTPVGDPSRIDSERDIWKMAEGPDAQLSFEQARTLVPLLRERDASHGRSDGEAALLSHFYDYAKGQIYWIGPQTPGASEKYWQFYQASRSAYQRGRAAGLSPEQLLDSTSKDYIGKNLGQFAQPPTDEQITQPQEPAAPQAPFRMEEVTSIPTGEKGSAQGVKALQDAVKAGRLNRQRAIDFALQRGWVRMGAPTAPAAPASNAPSPPTSTGQPRPTATGFPTGMVEPGNQNPFDYDKYPKVRNADGSVSNVVTFSANIDGKEVLLPSMIGGKRLTREQAIEHYRKTGENFGKFASVKDAEAFAQQIEERMQRE